MLEEDGNDTREDFEKHHFTDAGCEFVETCFDNLGVKPIARVSDSVREV